MENKSATAKSPPSRAQSMLARLSQFISESVQDFRLNQILIKMDALFKSRTARWFGVLFLLALTFFIVLFQVPQVEFLPAMVISDRLMRVNESLVKTMLPGVNKTLDFKITTKHPDKNNYVYKNEAAQLQYLAVKNQVHNISCKALSEGSTSEILKAKRVSQNLTVPITDEEYLHLTNDCDLFLSSRGYILSPLSKEEHDFPIAFTMLIFKNAEMVERLLKAIYRPQNYYCIHVDIKSSMVFYRAISSIAKCFSNVFLTTIRIDVQWGEFSVLEPELLCMEELWRYPNWKYFMTLTGQEFPLKTNHELVKIFTAYDGANDIEGTIKRANLNRWRSPPPQGIRPLKGSVHITVNRHFVDYILHNDTAQALLKWAKDNTSVPDETFFATLNHNPQLKIKGTYTGEPETDDIIKPFLTRYKNWGSMKCSGGVYVRAICILTLGDLPLLYNAKHYFANKFYLDEDRVVIGCLEEKIFNDTRDEYLGVKKFDVSYYENLGFVKNKVKS